MSPQPRRGPAVARHRVRVAVLALGTASGLVALFHYDGALPVATANTSLGGPAPDGAAAGTSGPAGGGGPGSPQGRVAGGSAAGRTPHAPAPGATGRPAGTPAARQAAVRTVLGAPATTRWGVVQVRIAVRDGRIVSAQAVQSPRSNPTSLSINARALPVLGAEAVSVQSGDVDAVSGATVTSGGYRTSLQSAVDRAALT